MRITDLLERDPVFEYLLAVDGPVGDHPDIVFIMHPVGDDVGAFDSGVFVAVAHNGDGLLRGAADRQGNLLAVGARADQNRVAWYHLVDRMLDGLEGLIDRAGIFV